MRVPYAQFLGKVPFKLLPSCLAPERRPRQLRGSVLDGQCLAPRRRQRARRAPGARHGNRLSAAQPVPGLGRHRRAAHRDQSRLPGGRQDHHPFRRCRHRRQARRPHRPQLDPADYRLAVDNARAALASAEADYARAKADHERYLNLRGTAVFTAQTMEQRQSLAATAQARVEQARSQLSSAENNLAYTELRSDTDGVVTAVQAEVGQVMAQGQGVVRVARTDELEIVVGVPEHRLKTVRESRSASFELWSDPGHRHAVRLRELSPSADPMTRTYPARFSITEPPPFIGLGMTATLAFERPEAQSVAEVPLSAIFQRGTQPAVWVVDKDNGTVALRSVTIARWRDETAAIASGVKDGELIATAGVHKLEAGQKVKPMPAQMQAAR